jgi:hypothetical protein
MRKARIAAALMALLFMVGVSAPAMASTAAPGRALAPSASFDSGPLNGGWHLCAKLDDLYCITSPGTGLQAEINTSGYATITLASIPDGPNTYTFTNSHGKCLRENGLDEVIIQGTGCNTGDPDEQWVANNDSDGYYFYNNGQGNLLVVPSIFKGAKVSGGTTNYDWHWYICLGTTCGF